MIAKNYCLIVAFCFIIKLASGVEVNSTKTTPLEVKKMLEEKCIKEYSLTCLKLDVARLIPSLSARRSYRIFPGLIVESGGYKSKIVGTGLSPEAVEPALDLYLSHGLDSFMDSLSLRIKVMDRPVVEKVKDIGYRMLNSTPAFVDQDDVSGRGRRKRINHALLVGGMVSAGTLLALTMSAISAMAGKALLASILSLTLTLMNNRNGQESSSHGGGGGGGGGKTTYEIITHSVPHHDQDYNRHTWSAEPASAQEAYHVVKAINPNTHQIHI